MTQTNECVQLTEDYLRALRSELRGLTPGAVEEVVSEMRAHILDSGASEPAEIRQVLARLGRPADLAAEYAMQSRVSAASRSWSPWVIVRGTARWGVLGVGGFFAFLSALVGYSVAVGFFVSALLKPIFPDAIGLWVGENVSFGFHDPASGPATELLGPWYQPFAVGLAVLAFIGTTRSTRWLLKRTWGRRQRRNAAAFSP